MRIYVRPSRLGYHHNPPRFISGHLNVFTMLLVLGLAAAISGVLAGSLVEAKHSENSYARENFKGALMLLGEDYTVTTTGGAIVVTNSTGTDDALNVSEPGAAEIIFTAPGRTFAIDGVGPISGTSGNLSTVGVNSITIDAAGGDDTINIGAFASPLPSLTLNGGDGDDTVMFNGSLTFNADANLDVDLQNDTATPGTDQVMFGSGAQILLQGTGSATVNVSRNISFSDNAQLQVVDGDLTLNANQQISHTAGDFAGVDVSGARVESIGSGVVTINGRAGTASASDFRCGVLVSNGGIISGGTSLTLTIVGNADTGSGQSLVGVLVTDPGSSITSSGADVSITGFGGDGPAPSNDGVRTDTLTQISANGDGALTVNGTGGGGGSGHVGVHVAGGTINSGGGNVSVTGQGANGDFNANHGVEVDSGGVVTAGGAGLRPIRAAPVVALGTVTVLGTGGAASGAAPVGDPSYGVYVHVTGSKIVSDIGPITVTGNAGANNNAFAIGVLIQDFGEIQTNGAGTLTINGTGGNVTTGGSDGGVDSGGLWVDTNAVVSSTGSAENAGAIIITGTAGPGGVGASQGIRINDPGTVTTVDGPLSLTGNSAAAANACLGTSIRGPVTATGIGSITINGTGGTESDLSDPNFPTHGVNVRAGAVVSAMSGGITITGTGGNGTDNAGFNMGSNGAGTLQTTGSGAIVINADTIKLATDINATIDAGANAVSLRQKTNGVGIDLGSVTDAAVNTLELSDAELNRISAGALNIGIGSTGPIVVSASIARVSATALVVTSGANIDVATGSLDSAGGNVSLNPGTDVFPSYGIVDVTTDAATTLTIPSGKTLRLVIAGTTADTSYTQLNVAGLVNISGVNLSLSGPHTPVAGETFMIVNNDGADPISGTFAGRPEGSFAANFLGTSFGTMITYVGGDGNDAVLTVVGSPTAAPAKISGQILDANGQPISGATINVSGEPNLIRAVTDANGFYQVDGLSVGEFYTVTPSRANYAFAPANRAFSLLADKTDAVFTGRVAGPEANPLESPEFFVRQQYLDFLNREPDQGGLDYWSAQLRACEADLNCLRTQKVSVSAAFFTSEEFQQSGSYIYRLYRAGLGRQLTNAEFTADKKLVVGGPDLELSRTQFADSFVQRSEFVEKYQNAGDAQTFVEAVTQTMLVDGQVDLSSQRDVLIAAYDGGSNGGDASHSRAAVLRAVAEYAEFKSKVYNSSFVLMEYFGYLQRGMDQAGFDFWLNVLNGQDNYRGMVCSFITSTEYQHRFGSLILHSNGECVGP